jgi:hypothetical protein
MVRGAYDLQKLRIMMGNRIVGNFKAKLGQEPGETEEDGISAEGKAILSDLRARYRRLTDGVTTSPRAKQAKFVGDEVISTYTEICLLESYFEIEKDEANHFKRLVSVLDEYPVWRQFLEPIRGIGPAMGGVIISEIDIAKARHPSSLWKYAGLDVAGDGRGRSRKAEHLVRAAYINKDGEAAERNSITFNPFLKTKLIGVLATSFLRSGNVKYRAIYDGYKHRLENREDWKDEKKGHRNNAALRYMIKMFLIDLYTAWRAIEGLPVSVPYHEAKLGYKHAA